MAPREPRRVTSYVRRDGTRVRSHTRSAGWARSRAAWASAGFATLTATAILWEAGVTVLATAGVALIALLTTVAVVAGHAVEKNRKTMAGQQRRSTRSRRTSSSRTRRRSSTGNRRTSSNRRRR